MSRVRPAVGVAVVFGLLAGLSLPSQIWLVRTWLVDPYYSHGPLVPFAAAWLLWRRRHDLRGDETWAGGFALVVAGLALQLFAAPRALHPISLLSLLLVGLGFVSLLRGRRAFRAAALPAALLALAVPQPWLDRVAPPLAGAVATWASHAATLLGVAVVQTGAQLAIGNGAFQVGGPCSGLRSAMAMLTLALVIAGMVDRPFTRRTAIVALAVPAALIANWLRLTGLLVLSNAIGASATLSVYHPLSSPAFFLAAAAALVVTTGAWGQRHRESTPKPQR